MDTKKCRVCGRTLPLCNYGKNKRTRDGLAHECKDCTRTYQRDWYIQNRDRVLLVQRECYERTRAKRLAQRKQYRTNNPLIFRVHWKVYAHKHPERIIAYDAVKYAIMSGRLVKKPCENCGAVRVHAHHDDYSKPLDIRWLCVTCHNGFHHRIKRFDQTPLRSM